VLGNISSFSTNTLAVMVRYGDGLVWFGSREAGGGLCPVDKLNGSLDGVAGGRGRGEWFIR
jgi:hypothetical protein